MSGARIRARGPAGKKSRLGWGLREKALSGSGPIHDVWTDPKFKATVTEIRDLRVHLSLSGDVAWYSASLDEPAKWDGKRVGAGNIRWPGVLEKRGGQWVAVQMHGSLPHQGAHQE